MSAIGNAPLTENHVDRQSDGIENDNKDPTVTDVINFFEKLSGNPGTHTVILKKKRRKNLKVYFGISSHQNGVNGQSPGTENVDVEQGITDRIFFFEKLCNGNPRSPIEKNKRPKNRKGTKFRKPSPERRLQLDNEVLTTLERPNFDVQLNTRFIPKVKNRMNSFEQVDNKQLPLHKGLKTRKSDDKIDYSAMTFQKRTGTTNEGQEFEDLMVASFSLDMTTDDQVKDFALSSNDNNFGAVDDIVFHVKSVDGTEKKCAIQLKYGNTQGKQKLQRAWLSGNKEFGLQKYHMAYKTISKKFGDYLLILSTNRKFSIKRDARSNELILKEENLVLKIETSEPSLMIFKENKKASRYFKFTIDEDKSTANSSKIKEWRRFLDNFLLQTNHMNINDLEATIWGKFQKGIADEKNAFKGFLEFINKWSARQKSKTVLYKELIKEVIALHLISPFMYKFSDEAKPINNKSKLLNKAISSFKITVFNENQVHRVKNLWQNFRRDLMSTDGWRKKVDKYYIICDVRDVKDLSDEECTKVMWLLGQLPLIVHYNKNVAKATELCQNSKLSFILLTEWCPPDIPRCDVFQNISNLKDKSEEIYQEILQFPLFLKNEKVYLKTVVEHNDRVPEMVTPNELILMAENSFKIGEVHHNIPTPYVNRFLSKILINFEFLRNFDETTTVVLISSCKPGQIQKYLKDYQIICVGPTTPSFVKNRKSKTIFVSEDECNASIIESFCITKMGHEFRFLEKGATLEWVRSSHGIADLKKYQLESEDRIEESELPLYELDNNVNIVCDEPGMGKSTLMKRLLNSSSDNYWPILIVARNHFFHFKEAGSDVRKFEQYILQKNEGKLGELEIETLKMFMRKGRVRYIWDGLDEVCDKNLENILKIIDKLTEKGCRHWISSRNTLRNTLEDRFNVIARTMKRFGETEQKKYLENRTLSRFFSKYQENGTLFWQNDFLGTPLQIYIFTEMLLRDPTKCDDMLKEKIAVADLYEGFIDAILDFQSEVKINPNLGNEVVSRKHSQEKLERIENYEKIAAHIYFEGKFPVEKEVTDFLKKTQSDEYGMIETIENNRPQFHHASFGEYFAASFLIKRLEHISHLETLLFENHNVRYFFDLIASKGSQAHRAVIHKNYELLKKCSSSELARKDMAGRSPLHIACSWGTKYPYLPVSLTGIGYEVDDRIVHWRLLKPEEPNYKNILNYLSDKCNPLEADNFGLNSFAYAYRSQCFLSFAFLKCNYETNINGFDEFVGTVLYYAVRFDCDSIFDTVKNIPFIRFKYFNNSLLYLAVHYNAINSLQKVFTNSNNHFYRNIVKHGDEPLLRLAYNNNRTKMLKLLIDNGADLEVEKLPVKVSRVKKRIKFTSMD